MGTMELSPHLLPNVGSTHTVLAVADLGVCCMCCPGRDYRMSVACGAHCSQSGTHSARGACIGVPRGHHMQCESWTVPSGCHMRHMFWEKGGTMCSVGPRSCVQMGPAWHLPHVLWVNSGPGGSTRSQMMGFHGPDPAHRLYIFLTLLCYNEQNNKLGSLAAATQLFVIRKDTFPCPLPPLLSAFQKQWISYSGVYCIWADAVFFFEPPASFSSWQGPALRVMGSVKIFHLDSLLRKNSSEWGKGRDCRKRATDLRLLTDALKNWILQHACVMLGKLLNDEHLWTVCFVFLFY